MGKVTAAAIRNRVKEPRMVRAAELVPNPKNWRTHPAAQLDALKGILSEVGYASALVARELPDGSLMLLDGHLRAETTPDMEVPVLVLDVTEAEADKLLASIDPLSAMAVPDDAAFKELLAGIQVDSDALKVMLDGVVDRTAGTAEPGISAWDFSQTEDIHIVTIRSPLPIADEIRERLRGISNVEIVEDNLCLPR